MSLHTPARAARGAAVLLLSSGLLLSACGGSDSKDTASTDTTGSSSTTGSNSGSDTSGSADSPAAAPTPSVAPKGFKALPGLPAVGNATDFKKEPTIAKGTGTAPTGLVIRDLIVGTGTAAKATDTVSVRYVGALYVDGKVFDASWKYGSDPTSFSLLQVVPGFAGGIVGMKPGGRREIVIPGDLGYGAQGSPPAIGPNAVLVFVVDYMSLGGGGQ
jgi:peptidylprolyl isomerase